MSLAPSIDSLAPPAWLGHLCIYAILETLAMDEPITKTGCSALDTRSFNP